MSKERELLKRVRDTLDLAPPKREPLSDEEINAIDLPEKQCTIRELVRIIEKAHGIGE